MAKILENRALSDGFYLLRAVERNRAEMGQFYMLRAWEYIPVLSRPISVFDAQRNEVTFLYRVVGQGTERFAQLRAGDSITLDGPYGKPFPACGGRIALVGGGVGIAPLYYAAKRLRALDPTVEIEIFLGFSDEPVLVEEYRRAADALVVNVGGFITDEIEPEGYDHIYSCGPEPMMRALHQKCAAAGVADRLLVSMENRMACGVGACLVCSCKTQGGNRKVCKDGPVFSGEEVFGI